MLKTFMRYLVCGAGGFIGGHLVKNLMDEGHEVICADVKPKEFWFQIFEKNKNYSLDLKDYENCKIVCQQDIDYVYNMACNMGGMGFIENNKAECMLSVLINTNMLRACAEYRIKKYLFSSSACVYNADRQKHTFIKGLKEEDAYPADPEDGYGWEKLFSERMCRHFKEDFDVDTKIVRYHNVYGPLGTYDGGREKAPAAICRKIAIAKMKKIDTIDVWGDGEQTRSFMFIDDCILGTKKILNFNSNDAFNLGSEEQVSINQMIDIISKIADYKINKNYLLDKPKGVRGRSSDNTKIFNDLRWKPEIKLIDGLTKTYEWIYNEIKNNSNNFKYTRAY
tara:strand:- start:12729 stop:13739 length:1011 start_codon:yes stop_codon:yes gene_type:complete